MQQLPKWSCCGQAASTTGYRSQLAAMLSMWKLRLLTPLNPIMRWLTDHLWVWNIKLLQKHKQVKRPNGPRETFWKDCRHWQLTIYNVSDHVSFDRFNKRWTVRWYGALQCWPVHTHTLLAHSFWPLCELPGCQHNIQGHFYTVSGGGSDRWPSDHGTNHFTAPHLKHWNPKRTTWFCFVCEGDDGQMVRGLVSVHQHVSTNCELVFSV